MSRSVFAVAAIALVVVLSFATTAAGLKYQLHHNDGALVPTLRVFIAYCPNNFSGEGAIVDVNPITAVWKIVAKVKFPSEIFGCIADYNPSYDFDQNDPNTLWFDFTSDTGFFLAVDTRYGNTTKVTSSNMFFTGFLDFKYFPAAGTLNGIAGAVTQNGFCFDGCLQYGVQDITRGAGFQRKALIPFKEGADDTSFVNWKTNELSFQGSYDLRKTTCGPSPTSQCMITIDSTTGALKSAVYTPDYQVWKFTRYQNPVDQTVKSFVSGGGCNQSSSSPWTYQFRDVDPITGATKTLTCVNDDLLINTDEWIASFAPDASLLATGSGNGDGDDPQLLVLNATSGSTVINSKLTGLAKALNADMGLVFIWALEFVGLVPN